MIVCDLLFRWYVRVSYFFSFKLKPTYFSCDGPCRVSFLVFLCSVLLNGVIDVFFIIFLMEREENYQMLYGYKLALMLAFGYGVLTISVLSFTVSFVSFSHISINTEKYLFVQVFPEIETSIHYPR